MSLPSPTPTPCCVALRRWFFKLVKRLFIFYILTTTNLSNIISTIFRCILVISLNPFIRARIGGKAICRTFPNGYSVMSAVPAPHAAADARAPKRAPGKTSANTSSWMSLPEEENTRYLPNTTPLKPFISAHFISNDGEAAPKTSRRRTYTPDERKRVANTRKHGACKECRARKVTVCLAIANR
jgi:hypothetical protein